LSVSVTQFSRDRVELFEALLQKVVGTTPACSPPSASFGHARSQKPQHSLDRCVAVVAGVAAFREERG